MITILITLWFSGHNITIDAEQMYKVKTLSGCQEMLPKIKNAWGSKGGTWFRGRILEDKLKAI